jgi:hypothetical protein
MLPVKFGFVLKQTGTANALLPLIVRLKDLGISVDVLAYNRAAFACLNSGVQVETITKAQEALNYFKNNPVALVITGTSLQSTDDGKLWAGLKKLNLKSIAYVEQWCNLRERFDGVDVLPDFIWIIDDTAAKRLARDIPSSAGKIKIVGSPAIEVKSYYELDEIRKRDKTVYYISQPMRDDDGKTSFHGYSQFYNFAIFKKALIKEWKIKVFLHPIDNRTNWLNHFSEVELKDIEFIEQGNKTELMGKAGLVVGLTSILLVETATAGLPTVSLQVGKKDDSDSYGIDVDRRIVKMVEEDKVTLEAFLKSFELTEKREKQILDSVNVMLCLLEKIK